MVRFPAVTTKQLYAVGLVVSTVPSPRVDYTTIPASTNNWNVETTLISDLQSLPSVLSSLNKVNCPSPVYISSVSLPDNISLKGCSLGLAMALAVALRNFKINDRLMFTGWVSGFGEGTSEDVFPIDRIEDKLAWGKQAGKTLVFPDRNKGSVVRKCSGGQCGFPMAGIVDALTYCCSDDTRGAVGIPVANLQEAMLVALCNAALPRVELTCCDVDTGRCFPVSQVTASGEFNDFVRRLPVFGLNCVLLTASKNNVTYICVYTAYTNILRLGKFPIISDELLGQMKPGESDGLHRRMKEFARFENVYRGEIKTVTPLWLFGAAEVCVAASLL